MFWSKSSQSETHEFIPLPSFILEHLHYVFPLSNVPPEKDVKIND